MSTTVFFTRIISRLKTSSLLKDSFWAVFGNGIGNFLLFVSGVMIARFLGKDLYGEYGMVKTTMYYIALFATLSLGSTSTKFVASSIQSAPQNVSAIIRDSLLITLFSSGLLCLIFILAAESLATFIHAPQLVASFRFLGIIVVFRAISTVGSGILAGYKDFKNLGFYNVLSGGVMFLLCIPLTKMFALKGALISLLISQTVISLLCLHRIHIISNHDVHPQNNSSSYIGSLLKFTYPFAIAELIFTVSNFGLNLIITRYSSVGELGIYTACSQWSSLVLFIPGLLGNVILSHLSTTATYDVTGHSSIMVKMLLINLLCTLIPLIIVCVCSTYIVNYYGPSYAGMRGVLILMVSSSIFRCLSRVFQSDLISVGEKWRLMIIRCSYNLLLLLLAYLLLSRTSVANAAMLLACLCVSIDALSLLIYYIDYRFRKNRNNLKYIKQQ